MMNESVTSCHWLCTSPSSVPQNCLINMHDSLISTSPTERCRVAVHSKKLFFRKLRCALANGSLASMPRRLRKWLPVTAGQLRTQDKEEIGGRSVLCVEEETHDLEALPCHFL
ncbi:hypothetical protein L345_02668, partial [Ophiophagus hannah]